MTSRNPLIVRHDAGALLRPRNIVLVGASDRPRHWSGRVYENLRRFGFPGGVYPVNPKRETIWDVPCFPNVAALPEAPDHILSFLPADLVPGLLREAAAAGARSALVFAGGFGEGNDPRGRERARELAEVIEETGIALCGPNCLGNVAAPSRAVTLPDDGLGGIEPGPVAVIAQSGGLCVALNRILAERAMMPSYLISCGNQVGLAAGDYIRFMANEPQVRAILLYLEQVTRVDDFLDACRTAQAAGKAVLAVKIGGSDAGRAAALAHTGSLAGAVEAFDAVAGAAGVTRFDCLEDAVEALEYAVRAAPPRGPAVAVVSNSGALKSLVSESAARAGVPLARFSEATQARISEQLAADAPPGNPVDTKQTIRTENYLACLDALADDPEVGLILLGEELPQVPGIERKESNLRGVAQWTRERRDRPPLALFTPVNVSPSAHAKSLRAGLAHLPYLSEPDRAFRVVQRFNDQIARRTRAEAGPGPAAGAEALASLQKIADARSDTPRTLSEAQSKALLAPWGLRAARETLAADPEAAAIAADAMGYPVVIKGVAPTLAHKTEAGAVMLNLADAAAVKAACATIAGNVETYAPGTKLEGFLVAEQVTGGAELALGISRDAEMGPVVMFGMGGVMLELYKDVAFGRAGLNRTEAAAMIDATRAGKLLAGWRGAPALDRDAVMAAIVALGALAAHAGDIIEAVDINPLVALPEGRGALALDALVVLRGTDGCPPIRKSGSPTAKAVPGTSARRTPRQP